MLTQLQIESFDRIYATDLAYVRYCWKLCGNAHCCNFSRYKAQFKMIGQHHYQELPLLPGEYEYLQKRGWLARFDGIELKTIDYPLSRGAMKIEFLVGRSKACACEHATRTTTCRLYPLLPVYDVDGAVIDVDTKFGIFEEVDKPL